MSANLVVDIAPTAQVPQLSICTNGSPASGVVVGQIIDLLHYDTFCNWFVAGGGNSGAASWSGVVGVAAQFSDSLTSGSFALSDPTSGQSAFLPSYDFVGIKRPASGIGIFVRRNAVRFS